MFSLALETSGRIGSVAIANDGVVIAERLYPHGLQHASALVPLIDQLCQEHSLTPADLEEIYVSIGPGSFTGLRVGVTLAKSLAFATGARLVAVPSVRVLAENAPADATCVAIVLDAKRGQIFTATYERAADGSWTETRPARLDRLASVIEQATRPLHLLGDGIPFHRGSIPIDDQIIVANESTWHATARVVSQLGAAMAARGEFANVFTIKPTYVRLPEAEEKRLIAEGRLNADGTKLAC
jgi:tRNA threonylcarbamoyladenosine biosynthesis protein TsaB